MLSTSPRFPISSHIPSSPTTTASLAALTSKAHNLVPQQPPRVLYRLAAVVCHYGQHSFGHYVCYRRKPRGTGRVVPPRLDEPPPAPGRGWLRASDDSVREVGIETVLQEGSGAFMLYYERGSDDDWPPTKSPRLGAVAVDDDDDNDDAGGGGCGSVIEEKIRTHRLQGGIIWESGEEEEAEREKEKVAPVIKARVVRSVSLGLEEDVVERASGSVKQEANLDADSEARLLSSLSAPAPAPARAKPEPVEVESTVELPMLTISPDSSSPIPDTPAVDEPPVSRTVDLRA